MGSSTASPRAAIQAADERTDEAAQIADSVGPLFRRYAFGSFVYLAITALIGFALLDDGFQRYAERTQWVTVHWNLGFQGWLVQLVAGALLFVASALVSRSVDVRLGRLQFWVMNAGVAAVGLGLALTAIREGSLGHGLMGDPPGRQVLTGLSEWGVADFVWLLQLGYVALGASFVLMFVNLRRTFQADAATRARSGLPGLYYEAASIFFVVAAVGWLGWTVEPVRSWLVSLPFLASGSGYQAVHHALFIHLPVWAVAAFAIGAAYQSIPALTGRDTITLTRGRELMFWLTLAGIVGTLWHPKVTEGPPVYMAAVVLLLFVALIDVVEFAGTWVNGAFRRLTSPEYGLARNYLAIGIVGVGIAAVLGVVMTFDPINSRIFPETADGGQGTWLSALHGMQGLLTGLTPLMMGIAYLVAHWALGARLQGARAANLILVGLVAGSYGFLFAVYQAVGAGWMTMDAMTMDRAVADAWMVVARLLALVVIASILGFFIHFWQVVRSRPTPVPAAALQPVA